MPNLRWRAAAVGAIAALLFACAENVTPGRPTAAGRSLASLTQAQSCDGLMTGLREVASREMNEQLDANLKIALDNRGCIYAMEDGRATASAGGTAAPPSPGGGATSYSTTNTQVVGVDEADFLKNDGQYLYVLAEGKLKIVQAWPPEQAQVVQSVAIEGTPRKMFVHADRAVVYSSLPGSTRPAQSDPYLGRGSGGEQEECTYGYACDFTGDGHPLKITVVDLTNRANPFVVRETVFSGSLINARRIGDAVHTVVASPDIQFAGVNHWPTNLNMCGSADEKTIREAFAALRAANEAAIAAATLTDWLPSIKDTRHIGGQALEESGLLAPCDQFWVSKTGDGAAFLSTVSFDPKAQGAIGASTVVGQPGAVYASDGALYVAARHRRDNVNGWFFEGDAIDEATSIHKFSLTANPPSAQYLGSGVVKGRVLNQFAMDELDSRLRIATTTGHLPSPDVHSTLTVLTPEAGGGLVEEGRVDSIAPGEDIRSVRFDGPRGFVVTFKKTDPLYVFDLADPAMPKIAGELKIPGFSTYMHLLDDTHLLSIGYDAEDRGGFAYFQGVLLQIFDIANPAAPALAHKTVIGTRGTSSEALTNHLAFNYFAPKGLLAIPMAVCEDSSGGGSYGEKMSFNGLMLYGVSAGTGFDYRGGVSHGLPATQNYRYQGACSNWWTNASSQVKRSVFMDDYVFSVATDQIHIQRVDALGSDVATVQIAPPKP